MSVLITGGSGFLGRALTKHLLAGGIRRVRIYSRGEFAQARMAAEFQDDRLGFFIGDVRDQDRLERAMQGIECVVHAAALKRIEVGAYNPDEMVKTNVIGSMNVIEAARRARVGKIVFVSSDKAYQPVSPYGQSKALAESLFLAVNRMNLGPRVAVCRYGNVAGSTGSVIPLWRQQIAAGEPITIRGMDTTRFWMTIDQAVELVVRAIDSWEEMLIPELPAYRLQDLAEAMGCVDGYPRYYTDPDSWEKRHECMGPYNCSDGARKMTVEEIEEALKHV